MIMLTTRRAFILPGVVLAALVVSCALAADQAAPSDPFSSELPKTVRQPQPRYVPTAGFYAAHLAPRMTADSRVDDVFLGAHLGDLPSSRWTSDPSVASFVERRTIRSVADAFKGYAIEQLGIDRWSLSVMGRSGGAPLAGASHAVRIRFGFSGMAPRADLLIPVAAGRVAFSADARGRMSGSFEPASSRFRLAADVDVSERTAAVKLGARF
jgi:hypothetical protein